MFKDSSIDFVILIKYAIYMKQEHWDYEIWFH